MGQPLDQLREELDAYAAAVHKIKQYTSLNWLNIPRQAIANLTNPDEISTEFSGPYYDETVLEGQQAGKDYSGLCVYYINRMILCYLFDKNEEALENGEQSLKLLDSVLATPHILPAHLYLPLTFIRAAEHTSGRHGSCVFMSADVTEPSARGRAVMNESRYPVDEEFEDRVAAHCLQLRVGNEHRSAGEGDQVLCHRALSFIKRMSVATFSAR